MSEAWLHVRSSIATGIYNLDSARRRNASLDKRKEGWTEVWGTEVEVDAEEKKDAWSYEEEEVISRALSTPYPLMPITLVQHRPAWFEQLILRFSGVAHIVVNSPYVATEATGPLPYLRHFCDPQVLVGRHNPSCSDDTSKNCILDYLTTQGYVALDKDLSSLQKSLSNAYTALIKSQLEPALLSLRFGDKDGAWESVYRQQYIQASKDGRKGYLPPLGSWLQAWSVRTVALKQLNGTWSVKECMNVAREVYVSLETQLEGNDYLLHTEYPTTVDALLWAHLADALCDVHLVTILADFPSLVKFFQSIYDKYFRLDTGAEWKVWNQKQNLSSPFQKLPLEETSSNEPATGTFHDALELMQSFSVHTHDLQEVLTVAKEKRQESEKRSVPTQQSTLYRWRMGGDIRPPKKESPETEETPLQEQYRKAHKQNDEVWLSAVLAVTAIAVFFGATTRSER